MRSIYSSLAAKTLISGAMKRTKHAERIRRRKWYHRKGYDIIIHRILEPSVLIINSGSRLLLRFLWLLAVCVQFARI